MQPLPSSVITAKVKHSLQPKSIGSVFLTRNVPHRAKPKLQRFTSAMKNCSGSDRSLLSTFSAIAQAPICSPSGCFSTVRTNKAAWPSQCLQVFDTSGFRAKPVLKLKQISWVIFLHTEGYYILWLLESSAYPRYIISFYGIIDVLAVLPGLLCIVFPFPSEAAWIRVFRILRFTRVSKAIRTGTGIGGITARLIPYLAFAIGLKGVMVAFEKEAWFPQLGNLSVVIGVAGFALAILLGTKLRVVNDRLYSVEDAICRIVGALRDMQYSDGYVTGYIRSWAKQFEEVLRNPNLAKVNVLRVETDKLEKRLNRQNIGGPNSAGFHRDVEYVLHRATAKTPKVFENFLKYTTIVYTFVVITAIPGFTGFLSSLLIAFVLGGTYLIIDDMDSPLDYSENSFINARLDSIRQFNAAPTV